MNEGIGINDLFVLLLMAIAGALLAAVYLAGLWVTVRRLHRYQHPALLLVTSIIMRMGLVVVGFLFILGDRHWQHLLAALAGFLTLRTLAIRRVRRRLPEARSEKENAV